MAPNYTWIALFRGINVGGHNILPMAGLRSGLESLGLKNVRTYIQSGNAVFDADTQDASLLKGQIAALVEEMNGFSPTLMLITRQELLAAVGSNPFPEAAEDPKRLHFFFLAEPPIAPDLKSLDLAKATSERYHLTDAVFYLHTPEGFAGSKLASKAERCLGVATTARNYATVERLMTMVAPPSN